MWQHLDEERYLTFSRSQGKAWRAALERYDHEFEFRHDVIVVAQQQTGHPGAPLPLVTPLLRSECDGCAWLSVCEDQLDPDDPSLVQRGRLDVRQWDALRKAGVGQADLAKLDALALRDGTVPTGSPTAQVLQTYLVEVTHLARSKAMTSLADAVVRADMAENGELLRRTTTGPLVIPRADVEVDVDLEWHDSGAIYLHGFLVSDGAKTPEYVPFFDLNVLDGASEIKLAERALRWLLDLERTVLAEGRTLLVYHYSHPERSKVRGLLEREASPLLDDFDALVGRVYIDLHAELKEHFFGLHGLGLKAFAGALGFSWRGQDAGGLQSQGWLEQAVADTQDDAPRLRLLEYNEDDVLATAHLRDRARLHGRALIGAPPAT